MGDVNDLRMAGDKHGLRMRVGPANGETPVPGSQSVDWTGFVRGMCHALNSTMLFIGDYDLLTGAGTIHHSYNVPRALVESYASKVSIDDIWQQTLLSSAIPGAASTIEAKLAGQNGHARNFYNAWLLPQGVTHLMFGVVSRKGTTVSHLTVGRGEEAGPYQPGDSLRCGEVLSQIQNLTKLESSAGQLREITGRNLEVLDLLPVGIVVLDARNAPIEMNRFARELLARSGLLKGLAAVLKSNGSGRGQQSRVMLIDRPNGERPLSAVLYPLASGASGPSSVDPAVVMFISDPDETIHIDRDRLRSFYGLTAAEARLAALLAQGLHLEEAGETLNISLYTARTHLKHIFSKTGTQTQADLIRLVLDLPIRIG